MLVLDSYDLAGYIDGSTSPPAATITANNTTTINPTFTKWKRQNKLIYSGLLYVISMSLQPLMSRSQMLTSGKLWLPPTLSQAEDTSNNSNNR